MVVGAGSFGFRQYRLRFGYGERKRRQRFDSTDYVQLGRDQVSYAVSPVGVVIDLNRERQVAPGSYADGQADADRLFGNRGRNRLVVDYLKVLRADPDVELFGNLDRDAFAYHNILGDDGQALADREEAIDRFLEALAATGTSDFDGIETEIVS